MANPNVLPRLELNGLSSNNTDNANFDSLYRSVSGFQAEAQGAEKTLNKISDGVTGANVKYQDLQSSALVAGAMAVKAADPGQLVSKGMAAVSKFAENSQVILKGLDAVKTIHPFIGIIVTAAAAAIQLELTRRQNDKKVIALKSEMLAMMEVLLDMRNIKDIHKVDPDGNTIEGRMQRIVKAAEQSIRDCSATCEKYIHKKFIVKLFDGARWEDRLAAFSDEFAAHKKEFQFALSVHTALGVDQVQVTLNRFEASSKDGHDAFQMILLFRQLDSPKERELQKWISDKGGPKAISEDEKLFKELQAKMKDSGAGLDKGKAESSEALMIQVRDEMREDIDRALAKDRKLFDRKFDAVQDKITELQHVVHRSTDRVLSAIDAGPHDRIIDIDLHTIWKDMAWRGSVKARHFIVAVQDYFLQKYSKEDREIDAAIRDAYEGASRPDSPVPMSAISDRPPSVVLTTAIEARQVQRELQDRWAIEYVTLTRVRPVLEAFDDDASGWISVKEANVFTASRPQNYSVIKWLAFWAAGFKIATAHYAQSIQNLRAHMMWLTCDVLPCNRARVDRYLHNNSLNTVDYLTRAMVAEWSDDNEDEVLMSHFNEYLETEKERIKKGLERFEWEIDAFNTLQLIVGTGRIERHVLTLFTLLLERHTQILLLAQSHPLDDRELWDAERTLDVVARAVTARVRDLASNFRNQNLDPKAEFDYAYGGIFAIAYKDLEDLDPLGDFEYEEGYEDRDLKPELSMLKYEPTPFLAPDYIYQEVNEEEEPSSAPFEDCYTGYETYENDSKWRECFVLTKFELDPNQPVTDSREGLKGTGRDCYGYFTVQGHWKEEGKPHQRRIDFTKTFVTGELMGVPYVYQGQVDFDENGRALKISGQWSEWNDGPENFKSLGTFTFDRIPSVVRRHRASREEELNSNSARARWNLALDFVLERVRRAAWSWSYFRTRRDQRNAYIDAVIRIRSTADSYRYPREWNDDDEGDDDHQTTLSAIQRVLAPEDVIAYNFIADWKLQKECVHIGSKCNLCNKQIIGGYHRCLDCKDDGDASLCIQLCINCIDKPVTYTADNGHILNHHPSHDLVKSIRMLHLRDIGPALSRCRYALPFPHPLIAEADAYFDGGGSQDNSQEEPYIPTCVYCEERVSMPCWYCTDCVEDCFLCLSCEKKYAAKALDYRYKAPRDPSDDDHVDEPGPAQEAEPTSDNDDAEKEQDNEEEEEEEEEGEEEGEEEPPAGDEEEEDNDKENKYEEYASSNSTEEDIPHKWWHVLYRVQDIPPEPSKVPVETRLGALEEKFAAHEVMMRQRLDKLESTIASQNNTEAMNSRLDSVSQAMNARLDGVSEAMNARLDNVAGAVHQRLDSLEKLLGQLLAKMG
ncbi:hypothetical protein BKA62DRAFT_278356 [Auriculariales sp. MPI-PUGE-AT-0066]|nr:hypothetical protein BKA62DRAFT_278356 [Auriculariales sp. MPI-PUGE-AT-0066]